MILLNIQQKKATQLRHFLLLCVISVMTYSLSAQTVITESFDGTTFPPTGWTTSGTGWWRSTGGTCPTQTPNSGVGEALFNSCGLSSGSYADLISPPFSLINAPYASSSPTVSFYMYRDNSYSTTADKFWVYISPNTTAGNGINLGSIYRYTSGTPGWYLYTFTIPSNYNTATNYLIFRGVSGYGSNIYIDDISWQTYPPCSFTGTANLSLAGNDSTCTGQSSTMKVDITGGTSPYTVKYANGLMTTSVNNYISGTNIPVWGNNNVYSLVEAADATGCTATTATGSASVTPIPNTYSNNAWLNRMGSTGGEYEPYQARDNLGNIWLTFEYNTSIDVNPGAGVSTLSSSGGYDIAVVKLDSLGNFVWAGKMGGTGDEYPEGIAVDMSTNEVYITGYYYNLFDADPTGATYNLGSNNINYTTGFVSKLNNTGSLSWAFMLNSWNQFYTGECMPYDISVRNGRVILTGKHNGTINFNPQGNAYSSAANGSSALSNGNYDGFVASFYTSNGTLAWESLVSTTNDDYTNKIYTDAGGNIYFSQDVGGYALRKWSASGTYLWGTSVSYSATYITGDASGNIYLVGTFSGTSDFDPSASIYNITATGGVANTFILKLNSTHNLVWVKTFANAYSFPHKIAVGTNGKLYISGGYKGTVDFDPSATSVYNLSSTGGATVYDGFLAELDDLGNFVNVRSFGSTGDEMAKGLNLDASNNVILSGSFKGTVDFDFGSGTSNLSTSGITDADIFIMKFNNDYTPPPTSVVPTTICAGNTATISATGSIAYRWYDAATGGNLLQMGSPTFITPVLTSSKIYYVCSYNPCSFLESVRIPVNVTVNPLPTVTASASVNTICVGASSVLTANGANTYSWSPAAGLSATTGSPVTATPTATTTYTVTGTDLNGCSSTATRSITVNPLPNVTITAGANAVCLGISTTLTANGANTYSWSPAGTLNTTTGASVTATPTATTTYTVIGTNTTTGCSKNATKAITVNALPNVAVTAASNSICLGSSTSLTASGANTYSWTPSTGLSATTGSSVTASPSVTTTYTVTGTNTTTGCVKSVTKMITVNPLPNVAVTAAANNICIGSSTSLTATGASTYTWSPATGLNATTGATLIANPTSATTYTVVGTDANTCSNSTSVAISVTQMPSISVTGPTSACTGSSISLTASPTGGTGTCSVQWENSLDGITWTTIAGATSNTYTTILNTSTYYRASYTCVSSPCPTVYSNVLLINAILFQPLLSTTTPTICTGGTAVLTMSGGNTATTYTWQRSTNSGSTWANITGYIGTNATSYSQNPTLNTLYRVVVSDPTCGTIVTSSVSVNVVPDPVVTVTASINNFCAGTSGTTLTATLAGGVGTGVYQWQRYIGTTWTAIAGATAATYTTPTIAANTNYRVISSQTGSGCVSTGTNSINITVKALPNIYTNPATPTFCTGGSVTITAYNGTSYSWSPATGLNNTTGSPVIANPTSSSTYSLTGVGTNGCSKTISVPVTVNQDPSIVIAGASSVCLGSSLTLTATPTGGAGTCTVQWQQSANGTTWTNIAGATGNSYLTAAITANTYYRATFTCSGGGCSPAGISNVLYVSTVSVQPILTSTTSSICVGGTVDMSISGGNANTTYTWQASSDGGVTWGNITGYVGTSSTTCSNAPSGNRLYRVIFNDPICGIQTTPSLSISVVLDPVVSVNASTNNFCAGTSGTTLSATLTGGVGTGVYQWQQYIGTTWTNIVGATAASYTTPAISTNTNFKVLASQTGSGCVATGTNSLSIAVLTLPNVYTNPSSATICTGGSATITAFNGTSYSWSPATGLNNTTGSPVIANPTSTTTYALTGTGTNGCSKTVNIPITVNADPGITIVGTSTIPVGTTTVLSATTTGGAGTCTLQWQSSSNGTTWANISGATAATYTTPAITATQYYRALYTCGGSGCSPAGVSNVLSVTGVQAPVRLGEKVYNLTLYPNPATIHLHILLLSSQDEKAIFSLTDMMGKNITQWEAKTEDGNYEQEISLENLSQGVYFLSVKMGDRLITERFVKE